MNNDEAKPLILSAPAPEREDDEADDLSGLSQAEVQERADLDALCQAYGDWCRTRGFFGPPPVQGSVLGKLTSKGGRRSNGGPDAACSAQLSALHIAVIAQPPEALDRRVFSLHYLYKVASIKQAADALGISRQHWYRLLHAFRMRVSGAASVIMRANLDAADRLPHRTWKASLTDESD